MTSTLIKERKNGASQHSIQKLTAQQQIFVKALLASKDFSLSDAAREAGYKYPGQSGRQLIRQAVIQATIGKELRLRKERLQWEADAVLEQLRTVIEMDITELYDNGGNIDMKKVKALPEHERRCIVGINTKRKSMTNEFGEREYYNEIELKWMDKNHALHLALKHFGLLNDDLHVQVMDEAMKRQLIVELMGQIAKKEHIVDAESIRTIAQEGQAVQQGTQEDNKEGQE